MSSLQHNTSRIMTSYGTSDYVLLVIYGGQGFMILLANGLLLLAILLNHSFRKRKELLIIGGMAGTDVIYGIGVFFMAIYRAVILWLGEQNDSETAWNCIILPPLFLLEISLQLTGVMNIFLSSDRLIAVAWPAKYRNLDKIYAHKILALVTLFGAISLMVMFITSYFGTADITRMTKMCSITPFSRAYNYYQATLITVAGYVSVIIYVGVFVSYRRTKRQIASHRDNQRMVAQERRLTVTLGIITISTLFLVVMPDTIYFVCAFMNIPPPGTSYLGIINRFSTICNVVIFVIRQKEVRKEMWKLLTCKKENRRTTTTTSNLTAVA